MNAHAKFTQGQWTAFYKHKYDEWHVSLPMAGSGMKLALCSDGIQSRNREADAHLIAAAPDMFEALVEARTQVDILQARLGIKDHGNGTLSIIDAALSKAIASRSEDALRTIRDGDAL